MVYVLAALGLHYYTQAFSHSSEEGLLLLAAGRLLTVAAPLVVEHRLQARRPSTCGVLA